MVTIRGEMGKFYVLKHSSAQALRKRGRMRKRMNLHMVDEGIDWMSGHDSRRLWTILPSSWTKAHLTGVLGQLLNACMVLVQICMRVAIDSVIRIK